MDELFTAEFWAMEVAQVEYDKSFTPFQNFKSNILKSKILIYTAQEIKDVWPKIHNHLSDFNINDKSTNWKTFLDELFSYAQTGLTSYYVYTEQALVTAITAMESYFINKLAYLIQNDPRLINRFLEKNIKLKRLVDYKLNISDNIGRLIVEEEDFQKLDNIKKIYQNKLGIDPFTREEEKILNRILAIRHLFVHRAGIIDLQFISKMEVDLKIGTRYCLSRSEIFHIIDFIDEIISKFESKITTKENKKV